MYCMHCGAKLREGAKFCHVCGTPVAKVRPAQPAAAVNKAADDLNVKAPADKTAVRGAIKEKAADLAKAGARQIIALLKDNDITAPAQGGEVSCKGDAAQNAFLKMLKKGLLSLAVFLGLSSPLSAQQTELKFNIEGPYGELTVKFTGVKDIRFIRDEEANNKTVHHFYEGTLTSDRIAVETIFVPSPGNYSKATYCTYIGFNDLYPSSNEDGFEATFPDHFKQKRDRSPQGNSLSLSDSFNMSPDAFGIIVDIAPGSDLEPDRYGPYEDQPIGIMMDNFHFAFISDGPVAVAEIDTQASSEADDISSGSYDTEGIEGIVDIDDDNVRSDSDDPEENHPGNWKVPAAVIGAIGAGAAIRAGRKKAAGKKSEGKKSSSDKKDDRNDNEDRDEEEEKATYEMCIRKDFGDTLTPGGGPQKVYARIVRIPLGGKASTDTALTSKISITGDGYLKVSGQRLSGGYICADVEAPQTGSIPEEAVVSFRLAGGGGAFTNRMHFKVVVPQIIFAQENLTLPACYDETVKLPFFVAGIDDNADISVSISGEAYAVSLEKGEYAGMWYAVIKERKKTAGEPGKYEPYSLNVAARSSAGGPELNGSLPVYRFNMGLVFNTEAFLGCYLEEYDVAKHIKELVVEGPTKKYAPAHTKFSFSIISWNEESHKIVRLLPDPKSITLKAVPLDAESDAESTDILSKDTRGMSDQELIDKIGTGFVLTNVLDDNSVAGIIYPKAILDAPARRKVNLVLEMKAGPQDTPYRAEHTIWLASQPLRQGGQDAILQAGKEDEQIIDNLNHIISYIKNHNLVRNIFPVMKMAEMMLDGYDVRFGFDPSQVYMVQSTFLRFLRGETTGANADPEKVPEIGLMAELMQMMAVTGEQAEQWFDTHGGFAMRLFAGALSLGWSEAALSAMRIPREMIDVVTREKEPGGALDAFFVGVKAVTIDFATEKVWGALGTECMKALKNFRPDLAENIARVAEEASGKAKKALGVLGKDVSLANLRKACTDAFGKKTASQLKSVKSANAAAKAEAEAIISKHRRLDDWTPEELAEDAAFREQNIAAIKKVKELEHAYHENYMWKSAETEAAFAEAVYAVQVDKLAQKQLSMYNGTYAYNIRSKYYQKLTADYAKVDKLTKQKVAAKLGVSEDDVEIFCASNSDSRRQFNGETITRDRDVTVAVKGKPTRSNPDPLSQDVSQEVAESAYNSSFKEVTGCDAVLADQAVVQSGSKEMIGSGVDDLERSFKKGRFGESLDDVQGVADAMQHKPSEWFKKGAELRSEGKLGLAQGNEEEGIRQIHKLWNNSVDPRSTARGNSSLITKNERVIYNILDHIEVVHQGPKSISVVQAKKILTGEFGMSLEDAAELLKKIVLRVES